MVGSQTAKSLAEEARPQAEIIYRQDFASNITASEKSDEYPLCEVQIAVPRRT